MVSKTSIAGAKRKAKKAPARQGALTGKKAKLNKTSKATKTHAAPPYGPNAPGMEKYLAAWTSLNENTFVNDPTLSVVDRGYLHGIQGTWRVKKPDWSIQSHELQIMLVWDYDHIWGSFDLVDYKGILMVDHGPRHEPPEQRSSPAYCNFTWRGKCTRNHSALINTPLVTKGKIELGSSWMRGYFDGMTDEDSDHRHFEGKPLMGLR